MGLCTYIGGGSTTDLTDATNWDTYPGSSDDVVVAAGQAATLVDGDAFIANSLQLNGSLTINGTCAIALATALIFNSQSAVAITQASGTLNITGQLVFLNGCNGTPTLSLGGDALNWNGNVNCDPGNADAMFFGSAATALTFNGAFTDVGPGGTTIFYGSFGVVVINGNFTAGPSFFTYGAAPWTSIEAYSATISGVTHTTGTVTLSNDGGGVPLTLTGTGGGGGTVPSASDVRFGVAVGSGAGTCYVPSAADVRFGTSVDATTGTCYVPTAAQTLYGVSVDATTGTVTLPNTDGSTPDAAQVSTAAHFGAGNATQGTLDLATYQLKTASVLLSAISAGTVVAGTTITATSGGNHVDGSYPTTATSQAAQLATDTAAVNAGKADILNTRTILGITGDLPPGSGGGVTVFNTGMGIGI